MAYPFKELEKKWQKRWDDEKTFRTADDIDTSKPKYYVLDMFPYPSGSGLHVGHPEGYTATDIVARYKRLKGFNVLHPMGWDAYGLPAEQYAIETGTHPRITTEKNISRFRTQLKAIGFSYDWDREVDTTDPDYYRWTQWIFIQLHKRGLAYLEEVPVNWCPELGTVLANEEVIDGKSERGGYPVYRRPMKQWMLRITEYAERLLEGLDELDWPESTKEMQRNWIGRSEGAEIDFAVAGHDGETIRVFTTRPDTIFGATYMVLAPEHRLVDVITSADQAAAINDYKLAASRKSDLERTELQKEKSGVFTGAFAVNPANGKEIPIWIADYVLSTYGTGAIMAVPGQDERDWEFAEIYDLPIIRTVEPPADFDGKAFTGEGPAINSDFLDGLQIADAKGKIISWLEDNSKGERKVNYKLRDWLFSRQRYWGEPFPILHAEDGSTITLDESGLPLRLPEMEDYKPRPGKSDDVEPKPPLSRASESWKFVEKDGKRYVREFNTMPQWAGSCWYYLRYIDPDNSKRLIDPDKEKYWMDVDLYIGGAEHSVLHLLYARFWHKVLFDIGVVSTSEPFRKLVHQGTILGEMEFSQYQDADGKAVSASEVERDGFHPASGQKLSAVRVADEDVEKKGEGFVLKSRPEIQLDARTFKMSKSRGNVVNPDDVIERYGADSLRLYEMFLGPLEQNKPWSTKGVEGVSRFLNRLWRVAIDDRDDTVLPQIDDSDPTGEQLRHLHATIKKVTEDIEELRFNTAIAQMMTLVNEANKWEKRPRSVISTLLVLLNPFAPHISEELWERLGNDGSIADQAWPEYDEAYLKKNSCQVVVQVNGKVRYRMEVETGLPKETLEEMAMNAERISEYVDGKTVVKVIVIPDKIVNIVVR